MSRRRVVVVGGGFGGLALAKRLRGADVVQPGLRDDPAPLRHAVIHQHLAEPGQIARRG